MKKTETGPLIIDYYSDVLCVWAWIAQRRVDELNAHWGEQIQFQYYYVDIFGDVAGKMARQWSERNSYAGFAQHVLDSASAFEDAPVSPALWDQVRPSTSANAHLVLKAVELLHGREASIDLALRTRRAVFVDARDISRLDVLQQLCDEADLDGPGVQSALLEGSAMAALMSDYQRSQQQGIKGSPSYVIDGGRQILYGNVGYRVLHANIEEVLKNPSDEASWC